KIKVVSDSIELLNDSWQLLKDQEQAYVAQKNMLAQNQKLVGDQTGGTVEDLKNGTQFFYDKHFEINKKLSGLAKQMGKVNMEIDRLQLELSNLNFTNNNKRYRVKVLLESQTARNRNIKLTYIVARAGWEPVYDILAKDISSPITLIYKAKAFNNTSIPWNNVKLVLSSSDPYLSAEQPSLNAWYLNFENYQTFKSRSRGNSTPAYNMMQTQSWSPSPGAIGGVNFKEVLVPDVAAEYEIQEP